jgi:hypothetical protein
MIIKYLLFELLFDIYFSIGSVMFSLCVLSIIFVVVISFNKRLRNICYENILDNTGKGELT